MAHAHHAGHALSHDHGGKAQQHTLHTAKGKGHEIEKTPGMMAGGHGGKKAGGHKMHRGHRMGK